MYNGLSKSFTNTVEYESGRHILQKAVETHVNHNR